MSTSSSPARHRGRPPAQSSSGRPLSPQQMARRLRTRLRLARAAIEREIGHSMTAIVPHTTHGSPRPNIALEPYSPLHRRHRSGISLLRSLTTRAHSYSHGDFPALHAESSVDCPRPLNDMPALGNSSTSRLHRHQSARPANTAHSNASAVRSRQPGATSTAMHPLDIPSSPPDALRTPKMLPLDYENEAAHTILMLATPPAARAPSLSESPCNRTAVLHCDRSTTQNPNRRLSFTKCAPSHSPNRLRRARQPATQQSELNTYEDGPDTTESLADNIPSNHTPNLSQITTSAYSTSAGMRPECHMRVAAIPRASQKPPPTIEDI
ncbi:hypothetical protein IW140_002822 [Coemansia sp. RSA 1813]|nr:hypothetical protein EV178_002742 [Coemansia sp. RSA 1646]KAJ1770101.1 hypothetical protein LPJ74_003462 [Coemansia sp. RSA 1843]KAJ2089861.1 hypothetical protein IW138_003155 [Coemansia sp. RSA 986]KAJ2214754.1 hypothetical protein EV179_002702 [Coemansia sp. RSA 487]KAJ2569741.1 hypothetical protein IW140_002822 [Coemansia sp. RSA 1813]